MIFVREWSSEQRHDAVAHDPVHHALIMVDGFEHVVENGVEELLCFLRVAICYDFERSDDVSK